VCESVCVLCEQGREGEGRKGKGEEGKGREEEKWKSMQRWGGERRKSATLPENHRTMY